jgi:XTP/dITP diphosphohydrolase
VRGKTPLQLVIASTNIHKIREFRSILKPLSHLDVLSLCDFPSYTPPEEAGASFEEIAKTKAQDAAAALNLWAIAD